MPFNSWNTITRDLLSGNAKRFHLEMTTAENLLKNSTDKDVVIPPLQYFPSSLFYQPTFEVKGNESHSNTPFMAAAWYNKSSVYYAAPFKIPQIQDDRFMKLLKALRHRIAN